MVANGQRALWTFLIYALAGPFFAALALVIVIALAGVFGLSGLLPVEVSGLGEAALAAFVWSAVPAVITGLILGGVIAFAGAAMLLPLDLHDARPYLAFLAGLVSVAVRQVLIQADIIVD